MNLKDIINRIMRVFKGKNSLPQPRIDPYAQKVESIDDLELARIFVSSITPEIEQMIKSYEEKGEINLIPLRTQISVEQTKELVKIFFLSIDANFSERINNIIDDNNPNIKLVMNLFDGKEDANVNSPSSNNTPLRVTVPIKGDLRQVYDLVHELTHTLDTENGDTTTRMILGEVAPLCMEGLLDNFLLNLTKEEMEKYGFNKSVLEDDIKERKIIKFIARFNNAKALDERRGNRVLCSRYMLSQIYLSHLNKFDINEQKSRVTSFINCVRDDDFEGANSAFDLQIGRDNKLQRDFYIRDTIQEISDLILPKEITTSKDEKELQNYIDKNNSLEYK